MHKKITYTRETVGKPYKHGDETHCIFVDEDFTFGDYLYNSYVEFDFMDNDNGTFTYFVVENGENTGEIYTVISIEDAIENVDF